MFILHTSGETGCYRRALKASLLRDRMLAMQLVCPRTEAPDWEPLFRTIRPFQEYEGLQGRDSGIALKISLCGWEHGDASTAPRRSEKILGVTH